VVAHGHEQRLPLGIEADRGAPDHRAAAEGSAPVGVLVVERRVELAILDEAGGRLAPPAERTVDVLEGFPRGDPESTGLGHRDGAGVGSGLDQEHAADLHPVMAVLLLEPAIETRHERGQVGGGDEAGPDGLAGSGRGAARLGRAGHGVEPGAPEIEGHREHLGPRSLRVGVNQGLEQERRLRG